MENDIILWQQAATTFGSSTLSHNGEIIKSSSSSYAELLGQVIISDFSSYKEFYKNERLQLYGDKHGCWMVLSNFVETDDNNRRIAFVAKIRTKSKKDIIPTLVKEAELSGKHLSQDGIGAITWLLYKNEILSFVAVFLFLIVSFVIIVVVRE